jgi:hypothetical protein
VLKAEGEEGRRNKVATVMQSEWTLYSICSQSGHYTVYAAEKKIKGFDF